MTFFLKKYAFVRAIPVRIDMIDCIKRPTSPATSAPELQPAADEFLSSARDAQYAAGGTLNPSHQNVLSQTSFVICSPNDAGE